MFPKLNECEEDYKSIDKEFKDINLDSLPKYSIWTFISIKTYRYTLITKVIAIRNYWEFYEYLVNWTDIWFTESEIIWEVDSEWNILF